VQGPFTGFLLLSLVVVPLAWLLAARLRLEREKRRADEAESRSRSYLSLIETLARSHSDGLRSGLDREEFLEAARREGMPESEVAALGRKLPPAGATPPGASKPVISDTRYLFVSFEEEIRRSADRGQPLTLLTLEAGPTSTAKIASDPAVADRILRGVAHAVRGQMRGCDTCIRYAAREFILILPGVSREESRRVEERIRTAVEAVTVEPRPGLVIHVHPVLGSATYPDDGSSIDQLLTLSDVRRSRDVSPDLPGSPGQSTPVSLPWQSRPPSQN
jgi:diguanylate cyclase (GGDEF)-like protein